MAVRGSTLWRYAFWGRPCNPQGPARIGCYGSGVLWVDTRCAAAFRALDAVMVRWGYRTEAHHTGAYNCRKIAGTSSMSPHAWAGAGDYNWLDNPAGSRLVTDMPPGMVAQILALRTNAGSPVFRWGGAFRRYKDAMHFEIISTPLELASGIRGFVKPTSPTATSAPPAPIKDWFAMASEADLRRIVTEVVRAEVAVTSASGKAAVVAANNAGQRAVNAAHEAQAARDTHWRRMWGTDPESGMVQVQRLLQRIADKLGA